ncbi:diacylglycerol kinase [Bacteroidia bacterium]|nr:diacylglycerol kinase [Bacteroidia bacterium]
MQQINPLAVQWQIIINPNACSGKLLNRIDKILDLLTTKKIDYEGHILDSEQKATKTIERLCHKGFRYFMFLGGDGTANVVINAICKSGINPADVFLVPIPIGTGNDWVHTLNYPKSKEYATLINALTRGKFMQHDIGRLDIDVHQHIPYSRHFINIAGLGFDGAVIERSTTKPKLFPSLVYLWNVLKALLSYSSKKLNIEIEDTVINDKIYTMAVGICKYNGNGMKQVPMADPTDGLFDAVIVRHMPMWKVLANVGNLFKGTHIKLKEVSVHRCKELKITCFQDTFCEVEGETLPLGDYFMTVLPNKINVLEV